jgi:hypothetical protein
MDINRFRTRTLSLGSAVAALILTLSSACMDTPRRGWSRVAGVVAAAKTAEGVPNLLVALTRDGRILRAEPNDAGGRFAFDDVEAGR